MKALMNFRISRREFMFMRAPFRCRAIP
jgi:hypothetical protein